MTQARQVGPAPTVLRWARWSPTTLTTRTTASSTDFCMKHTCRGSSACSVPLGTCQSTAPDQASCDSDRTSQDILQCSTLTCFLVAETAAIVLWQLPRELCSAEGHKQKRTTVRCGHDLLAHASHLFVIRTSLCCSCCRNVKRNFAVTATRLCHSFRSYAKGPYDLGHSCDKNNTWF